MMYNVLVEDIGTHQDKKERWPHDSVGHRMTAKVPVAREEDTIGDVRDALRKAKDFETISYVYVLERSGKLIGVLSIKDVFHHPAHERVGKICRKTSLVTIHPEEDQEHAAYLALKNNVKALPVIDRDHHFLGALPSDVILAILQRETHEDMLHSIGIHHHGIHHAQPFDNVLRLSLFRSFLHRIPWLILGLLGGLLAARIIGVFEHTLQQNLILAAFIPLIVYMSDAVETQTEILFIRDLAVEKRLPFLAYFLKQLCIVLLIAALLGLVLTTATFWWYHEARLSLVLGASLVIAVMSSVFTGLLIPYAFSRLKMDPANASGPTATIIQDLLSVIIYFVIATVLM